MSQAYAGTLNGKTGLFVARPGYQVESAAPDDLALSTDLTLFQPIASGTVGFSLSGSTATASAPLPQSYPFANIIRWVSWWFVKNGTIYAPSTDANLVVNGRMITSISGSTINFRIVDCPGAQPYATWVIFRALY